MLTVMSTRTSCTPPARRAAGRQDIPGGPKEFGPCLDTFTGSPFSCIACSVPRSVKPCWGGLDQTGASASIGRDGHCVRQDLSTSTPIKCGWRCMTPKPVWFD